MRLDIRRVLKSPWPLIVLILAGVAIAVSAEPLVTASAIGVLSLVAALVWRFGFREGLWYVMLAVIPLRAALSVEVLKTTSLFFGDLVIVGLFIDLVYRRGLRAVWEASATFKIGAVIVALSFFGLYAATRAYWGFVSVYGIVLQVFVLAVARDIVDTPEKAVRALMALVAGLCAPIVYGLYQSMLPYGAEVPGWSNTFTAYSANGEPHLRVFSTFAHPLRFSHYMSVGFAIVIGLAIAGISVGRKLLALFIGLAAAVANYFTYSIGGVGTMFVAALTVLATGARRRAAFLAVVLVIPVVLLFSGALGNRVAHLLSGQSSSFAARIVTYQQAINIMHDHPLVGVGWGGIVSSLESSYRLTRSYVVAMCAENYFLHRGMALGVPGLLLYGAVFVLFIRNSLRSRDGPGRSAWPRAAILAGGVAFYVQAQVMPTTDVSGNLLLWVLLGLSESMHAATSGGSTAVVASGPPVGTDSVSEGRAGAAEVERI